MADALTADMVAASWSDGRQVDLDAECRRLTLRALPPAGEPAPRPPPCAG